MNPLPQSNNSNKPKIIHNPVGTLVEQDDEVPNLEPIITLPIPKIPLPALISMNEYFLHKNLVIVTDMLIRAEYTNEQTIPIINDFFMKRIWVMQLLISIKKFNGYIYRENDTMKAINYIVAYNENSRDNIEKYLKIGRENACSKLYIAREIQNLVNYFYKIENFDSKNKLIVDGFLQERISLKELVDILCQNYNINIDTKYYIIFTTRYLKKTESFHFIAVHLNYLRNKQNIVSIQIEDDADVIMIEDDD
jgi:hypothetical protein